MASTRKSLERIPDNKLAWKPHAKSATLGGLGTHLATINGWAEAILGQDSFDVKDAPSPPKLTSRAQMLEAFDKNAASARKAIAAASDEQLMKPWSLLSNGKSVFTMPRAGVLRSFILEPFDSSSGAVGRVSALE